MALAWLLGLWLLVLGLLEVAAALLLRSALRRSGPGTL